MGKFYKSKNFMILVVLIGLVIIIAWVALRNQPNDSEGLTKVDQPMQSSYQSQDYHAPQFDYEMLYTPPPPTPPLQEEVQGDYDQISYGLDGGMDYAML